jgi:hypothetical protein
MNNAGLEELARFGLTKVVHDSTDYTVAAIRELEQWASVKVGAVVTAELGSVNTAESIATAIRLGAAIVDGDYVGRAIPELQIMKPEISGCSWHPAALVDRWGNTLILKDVASTAMADRIARMLSIRGLWGWRWRRGLPAPSQRGKEIPGPQQPQ